MSFADVLAAAREPTTAERAELIRELNGQMPPAFQTWAESGQSLNMSSPMFAPEAASALYQLLEQERTAR